MKTLIVTAHPERNSFNRAMADAIADSLSSFGHQVEILDLFAEAFDPVVRPAQFPSRPEGVRFEVMAEQARQAAAGDAPDDVARSQALLRAADNLVLQFPLWWWSLPGQMKGWVDRVFSADFAYGAADLSGRRAMLAVTAETRAERFLAEGSAHPLHHIERGILGFSGYCVLPAFVVADVYALGDEARRRQLDRLRTHVRTHFAAPTAGGRRNRPLADVETAEP